MTKKCKCCGTLYQVWPELKISVDNQPCSGCGLSELETGKLGFRKSKKLEGYPLYKPYK